MLDKQQEEIERLNKQIEEYQKALDETTSEKVDLYSIIKEVREMREYLSNKYYEMGEEVDMGVIIEHLDRILDKAGSENNGS